MTNAFAFGIAISNEASAHIGLTIVEQDDDSESSSLVVRRTVTEPFEGDVAAIASDLQGQLAKDPYTARSSLVVRVDNEEGEALADALSDRGVRPVRVRVRSNNEGTTAGSEGEAVIDAREELFELSTAHRTGTLRMDHRDTEDTARLARTLGHLIDDSSEGGEIDAGHFGVQGMSALLAYWWSTEQTEDPTEHLRADLPGTGPTGPAV